MDSLTLRMRDNFDRSAEAYDRFASVQKRAARILCADLAGFGGKDILDAGCGSGFLSVLLERKFSPGHFWLNDTSGRMLSLCRKKLPRSKRFVPVQGDFLSLHPPQRFDLVTANMLFQWFPRPGRTFRQAKKLLRTGGTFAFSLCVRGTFAELADSLARSKRKHAILDMIEGRTVKKSLKAAGFSRIRTRIRVFREMYPSVLRFLRRMKETGMVYPSGRPLSYSVMRRMMRTYAERFGERGRIPVTWKILFVKCEKPA